MLKLWLQGWARAKVHKTAAEHISGLGSLLIMGMKKTCGVAEVHLLAAHPLPVASDDVWLWACLRAGLVAIDLARQMLQLYPDMYVLVVSHENLTNNW